MNKLTIAILLAVIIAMFLFGLYMIFYETNMYHDELHTETAAEIQFEPIPVEPEIVFEPIEADETDDPEETAAPDTADVAPKMEDYTAETEENMPLNGLNCEKSANQAYNDSDLMLLARIVENEAGSNWCTDEHQRAVASVVINRVNDDRFPDTVYGVISQGWHGECPVQYAVGGEERFFNIVPSERALQNAAYVLENGSTVDGAVWQAEFIQGEIVAVFEYASSTTYICR